MNQSNLFDLFPGLPFDPPLKDAAEIEAAVEKQFAEWRDAVAREDYQAERLRALLDREKEIKAVLLDPERMGAEASAMRERQIAALREEAALQLEAGYKRVYSSSMIRRSMAHYRLHRFSVIKAYKEAGFSFNELRLPKGIGDVLLSERRLERIDEALAALRKVVAPAFPNAPAVNDLYDALGLPDGQPCEGVRSMTVSELGEAFAELARRLREKDEAAGHAAAALAETAMSTAFVDEESKAKYDRSLRFFALQKEHRFEVLAGVAPALKLEPKLAEAMIREIQHTFPDRAEALLIYNLLAVTRGEVYLGAE